MFCGNPKCIGNYDFDRISAFAIQRFVDGHNTIDMLTEAKTSREVEEICLVCLLDVDDNKITELDLSCLHSVDCEVTNCREQLRELIEYELKINKNECSFKKIL